MKPSPESPRKSRRASSPKSRRGSPPESGPDSGSKSGPKPAAKSGTRSGPKSRPKSASKSRPKSAPKSRKGEVRCLNCFKRFRPPTRAERAACPFCKVEWRISYPAPGTPKIRGPVWDTYPAPKES